MRIGQLRAEQVAMWQAELLKTLAPSTVTDVRSTFRSIATAEAASRLLDPTRTPP